MESPARKLRTIIRKGLPSNTINRHRIWKEPSTTNSLGSLEEPVQEHACGRYQECRAASEKAEGGAIDFLRILFDRPYMATITSTSQRMRLSQISLGCPSVGGDQLTKAFVSQSRMRALRAFRLLRDRHDAPICLSPLSHAVQNMFMCVHIYIYVCKCVCVCVCAVCHM